MVGEKYWYIMEYITYQYFFPQWSDLQSRFPGPTPSNAPRNDVAPLKTITYRARKTTGTLLTINVPLFKKLRDIIFFCGTITL